MRLTRLSKDQKVRLLRDVEHLLALKGDDRSRAHYRTSHSASSSSLKLIEKLSNAFAKIDPDILKDAQGYRQPLPTLLDQLTQIATRAQRYHEGFLQNPFPKTLPVHVGRCYLVLDIFSRWNPEGRTNFPVSGPYPKELGQEPPPNWKKLIALGLDANGNPSSKAMIFAEAISLNFSDWPLHLSAPMNIARAELFDNPPLDYSQ